MFQWTEEQEMVRVAVRQFIDKEIRPRVDEFEHGDTPPYEVLRKLFRDFGMDSAARERFAKQIAFDKEVAAAVAAGETPPEKAKRDGDGGASSLTLIPIIEPEVTISIADKAEAEKLLLKALKRHLDTLPDGTEVMLKLTLPEEANLYKPLVDHPAVMRVVALSGGYSRNEANRRLAQNTGIVASFSRALTEGLSADQSNTEFNKAIGATIDSIHAASVAG